MAGLLEAQVRELAALGFVLEREVKLCYSGSCSRYAIVRHGQDLFVTLHEPSDGKQTVIFTFIVTPYVVGDGIMAKLKSMVASTLNAVTVDYDLYNRGKNSEKKSLAIRAVTEVPAGNGAVVALVAKSKELHRAIKTMMAKATIYRLEHHNEGDSSIAMPS